MFWSLGIFDLFRGGLVALLSRHLPDRFDPLLVGVGFVLVMAISYLLGSMNWAVFISHVFYHDDIRKHGSGNAGTTNMLRTYGKKAALATFLGDGLKGVLAILIACGLFGGLVWLDVVAAYLAAFCAILGHVFPCFAKFKGGKGFATFAFCALALSPALFLILAFIFITLVLGTHFVSLGSVVTALFYPILLASFTPYGANTLFALLIAALITWCHRSNIKRIRERTERKTYFFGKKERADGTEDTKK